MSQNREHIRGWYWTYVEQKCKCQYCGFDGLQSKEHWLQLQGDHLIPRDIAGEFAEEKLNRVVSCFYCNMIKRNWDPARGEFRKISDVATQRSLIEAAKAEIQRRIEFNWRGGGGLAKSFEMMRRDIASYD